MTGQSKMQIQDSFHSKKDYSKANIDSQFIFDLSYYISVIQGVRGQFFFWFGSDTMASLSDWTLGQSKNLKKESKLLKRAFQITYFILILIYRWIRLKKYLRAIFGF